ncbi:MAG: hypothetical protein LiPW15_242 [Parcubacteria group bacterium LiPW_15]|nr:MAG: hypothetical protein LiPW15_242 [Parcubacteria group bacterium LiPW_15]
MDFKYTTILGAEAETVTLEEIAAAERSLSIPDQKLDFFGILPENLRKLVALRHRWDAELKEKGSKLTTMEMVSRLLGGLSPADKERVAQAADLAEKIKDVDAFLLTEMRAVFKVRGLGQLAIGVGWKVYFMDPVCIDCGQRHPQHSKEDAVPGMGMRGRAPRQR